MTITRRIPALQELKSAERFCNQGIGVTCVRDIVKMLETGNASAALRIAIHDNDKIRNYPELQKLLRTLLPDYDSHLTNLEKMFGN
jgi:hypothetical protein